MGIRESYENGVFSWVDLVTPDPDAAKQFYSNLFGWEFEDRPVPGSTPYCMALKGDRTVAALFGMPDDKKEQNIPPRWQSYINVRDLEATVQSWQTHGGTVLFPPCDVMEAGRMAVMQDPTGAVVSLWQAKEHMGAELVNEVNTLCWNELQTRDAEKAANFYHAVLDWETEVDEKPPYYITCKVKGHMNGGMFDMDKAGLPPEIPVNWAVYFNVEDIDVAIEKVKSTGGAVMMDPIDIEPGRFTTITDPQGAVFTIMQVNDPED